MQTLRLAALTLMVAILAGCGGSQPPIGAPGAMPQASAIAQRAARGKSWMLSSDSRLPRRGGSYGNQDLLYVTTLGDVAYVLSYPDGHVLGSLVFKTNVGNLCVDGLGNVYFIFPNHTQSTIIEYFDGGNQPIRTFSDDWGSADSCSIDPSTGDLAVMNLDDGRGGSGSVVVFQSASQQPQLYVSAQVPNVISGAYDAAGNLLIDGDINFAVLVPNSGNLANVNFKRRPKYPGTIIWDGEYFAVGDRLVSKHRGTTISRVRIQGSVGTVVSKVKLLGKKIEFGYVLGNVALAALGHRQEELGFWSYPNGRNTIKIIPQIAKESYLEHEAVSPASHR